MNAASTAVYSKLTNTSGITNLLASSGAVYLQQAPQGATYPLVIFQTMAETDDNQTRRRAKQLLVLVKAVSLVSIKEAGAIDDAIDAALHGLPLTITGWTNFVLWRESSVEYIEDLPGGGVAYTQGGVYRLRLAK